MNHGRMLTYRFLELPYVCKMEVVNQLGLTEEGDANLDEHSRNVLYFKRAKERSILGQMWDAINEQQDEEDRKPNPYRAVEQILVDPEFVRLSAIAIEINQKYRSAMNDLQEKCPAPDGCHWTINESGEVVAERNG